MKRKTREIKPMPYPLLAWKCECPCGLVAYSFDPYQAIQRLSCGHDRGRLIRVIYFQKKFMDYCSVCNRPARTHKGERRDEMFYEAICPMKEEMKNGTPKT